MGLKRSGVTIIRAMEKGPKTRRRRAALSGGALVAEVDLVAVLQES